MAAMARKQARSQPNQVREFVRVARELGCEESEAEFDKTLKKIGQIGKAAVPRKQPTRRGARKAK